MSRNRSNFNAAFAKLAAEEAKFFAGQFLSPVLRGQPLRVRLSGVVLTLRIGSPSSRRDFSGWGVFTPTDTKTAKFVREANMTERHEYLSLFPAVRLVACARTEAGQWLGLHAYSGDTRFKIEGLVPVRLPGEIQTFERIVTRFDGHNFWFEGSDPSARLRNAVTLREALANETEADKVDAEGLTREERQAYAIAFLREIENKKDKNEERLKLAIQRAGAEYRSYVERGDSYTVEYLVDGQRHQSVVSKDTLGVVSAGICLSGGDRAFDLQSLVGVIREGIQRRRIVNVGLNYNPDEDDDY